MKAITMNKTGTPDVLELVDVPEPELDSSTQVKIKVMAAGVNPIDTKLRKGAYAVDPLPDILGCDGAGIIVETGSDVKDFKLDDEVYYFYGGLSGIPGNYAEYIVLEQHHLARKPENLSFEQAAAAPLVLLTAWEALFDRARLEAGNTVLIHAGAGGVGHVAIQLARNAGARVATTVSSQEKAELVSSLRAEKIINYRKQDFVESVLEWTQGKGVDVVMDNVGGQVLQCSFPATRVYGHIVSLLIADAKTDWTQARVRNLSFSHEVMLTPLLLDLHEAQCHQSWILEQCRVMFEAEQLTIHINDILPLTHAKQAHEMIESGSITGKIVLKVV